MAGSDMYFVSSDQVANLAGTGNVQPSYKSDLQVSNTLAAPPPWAKLSKSFCMSTTQVNSLKSGTRFIYAIGRSSVSGSGTTLQFSRHDSYSTLQGDFNVAGNTSSGSDVGPILKATDMEVIIKIHGIVLFIAWLVAPVIGIFVARYLKDVLGKNWYLIHAGLLGLVTVGGTWFGIILMVLYRKPVPGHFDDETRLGRVWMLI